jgi:hypothetical protein
MLADLLADAEWECTGSEPGRYEDPSELDAVEVWWPAEVPGTAAGALRLAGLTRPRRFDYDAQDWWFRTSVSTPDGTFGLAFDGLATLADVWLDGCHLLRSENMFRRSERRCELSRGVHRFVARGRGGRRRGPAIRAFDGFAPPCRAESVRGTCRRTSPQSWGHGGP